MLLTLLSQGPLRFFCPFDSLFSSAHLAQTQPESGTALRNAVCSFRLYTTPPYPLTPLSIPPSSNPSSPIHKPSPISRTQSPLRLPPRSPPPIAPHLLDPELGDKPVKHEPASIPDPGLAKHHLPEPVPFSYSPSPHPVEQRWVRHLLSTIVHTLTHLPAFFFLFPSLWLLQNPPPPPPLHLSFTPAVFAVPYELNMPHRVEDRTR